MKFETTIAGYLEKSAVSIKKESNELLIQKQMSDYIHSRLHELTGFPAWEMEKLTRLIQKDDHLLQFFSFLKACPKVCFDLSIQILEKISNNDEHSVFEKNISEALKNLTTIVKLSENTSTEILLGFIDCFENRSIEELMRGLNAIANANVGSTDFIWHDAKVVELMDTVAQAKIMEPFRKIFTNNISKKPFDFISLKDNSASFYNTKPSANIVSGKKIKPRVS